MSEFDNDLKTRSAKFIMPLYTRSKRSSGYLMTKKNLTIRQIKELLLKKGFILKKKKFPLG